MPTPRNIVANSMSRVWLMEDGAGPITVPEYMGVARAGAPSKSYGAATPVEIPSDSAYDQFQEVASLAGARTKPTMTFSARYTFEESDFLRIAERECYHDFQVHMGACEDPTDFLGGWAKILVLERGRISDYSADELGALASDERAAVNESITVEGELLYEILEMEFAEICAASVIQEVLDVDICDNRACGECGEVSDGCQKVFALVKSVGGSPGLGAQVIVSSDGGSTCDDSPITTMPANHDPNRMACAGTYLVVVSEDTISHHFALIAELILGTETWQEQAGGYNVGGGPRCIFTLKPGYTWIGGAGGYIYHLANALSQPTILDAGSATTEDLNDVHAYDENHILMVGNNNAVVYAADGVTFTNITGPNPGVVLNACWMKTLTEWWVGDAGGQLWYTRNAGATWIEKLFPGSGVGAVRDIIFASRQVVYLAHNTATPAGRILRSIDGGYEFYVMPEGTGSIPANDYINQLASCKPNVVFGGGLADNGADGIMLKATG